MKLIWDLRTHSIPFLPLSPFYSLQLLAHLLRGLLKCATRVLCLTQSDECCERALCVPYMVGAYNEKKIWLMMELSSTSELIKINHFLGIVKSHSLIKVCVCSEYTRQKRVQQSVVNAIMQFFISVGMQLRVTTTRAAAKIASLARAS